jgi:hypothetical protein
MKSDALNIDAQHALSEAAWELVMEGASAHQEQAQTAECPYPKASLMGQLWGAGYFMRTAEAMGADAGNGAPLTNPYLGGGMIRGVVTGPFAGRRVQRAYLAKIWQDAFDLQAAENQALNANADQVQP